LFHRFAIKKNFKEGDALSPLLFKFSLQYAIRRVQTNEGGLKLHGTHQLVVYAADANKLGGSIHTIIKNTTFNSL
jgi:hypothetical protein